MIATAELEFASIAAGGDGVGRTEGQVVFVPRAAPGDVVRVALEAKGRFARGEITELLRAAPARVDPPCPHYTADRCGGCQLQHMSYDAQLAAKERIIVDTLARIGKREVAVREVRPSAQPWRYRRKLTLALRWARGRGWIAGLHPYDDPGAVFALGDCPITDERVDAVWRAIMRHAKLLPRVPALRGAVRLLDHGASFVLEGGRQWREAEALLAGVPELRAIWWAPEGGRPRLVARRDEAATAGASFVQVNVAVGGALHDHVVERVLSYAPRVVVDAYAGTGDTAVRFAAAGARVTAIELDREAAALAASRLAAPSTVVVGKVEEHLAATLPADVVVINPPRTGVDPRVTDALERARPAPRAVIYVSCDPATLARDLARMPGYRVRDAIAFDMFPQTAHVETVCELVPEAA
ncbi:MAG: class I SAM-dependent RNA methyltransferase [Gemmatimonadaceae bacterium]|nr:class I SAM-dependent RNA methyltransferase [Gemmatimonadaceae bacterium]